MTAISLRSIRVWNPLDAPDKGHANLKENGNLWAVQLLLGHNKMDSTVSYLGVELDDALAIEI